MTDSRILFRNAGLSVLSGVRKDNADLVATAPYGDLAMADAIAMGAMAGGPQGKHARLGLALEAILADAPNALVALLTSPAWLAARLDGGPDVKSWALLSLEAAARNKSPACARAILSHWPNSAWPLASLSAPFASTSPFDGLHAPAANNGASGWLDGFEMACAAIMSTVSAQGAPATFDARSASLANEAIIAAHKGARAIPKSDEARRIISSIHGPSEALLESGALSSAAAKALMDSAIHPLPKQLDIFHLAMSSWRADASLASLAGLVDRSEVGSPRLKFSLDRRGRSGNGLTAIFPESVTVAWAAASKASALSLSLSSISELFAMASSMAAIHGSEGEQAMMAPQVAFAGAVPPHPLAGIWRDWNNSRRAGFAMSPAVLRKTEDAAQSHFERWRGLIDDAKLDQWKASFSTVMRKLLSGVVPESFEGYAQAPDLQAEAILPEAAMSPMAWRVWLDDGISSADVAAIAVAQSAAGFSLKSSLLQIAQMGMDFPPSHVAAAEAAILEMSVIDPTALPSSARSMRI